jgi:small nuclear ribonucleoprotein (snRNP)-like protein
LPHTESIKITTISDGLANLLHKVPVTVNYHQMVYGNITDCDIYMAFLSTDVEEVVSINTKNRR